MRPYLVVLGIFLVILMGIMASGYNRQNGDQVIRTARQASQKNNPTLCDVLAPRTTVEPRGRDGGRGLPYVSYPRNRCLLAYLRETNDRRVCDMLNAQDDDANGGAREYCHNYVADVLQDPSVCQKLQGTPHSWKAVPICIAVATRNVHECDVLEKEEKHLSYSPKTDCILEVVSRTKDYKICAGITGQGYGSIDEDGGDSEHNACLKIAGCDKPDQRQEICSLMRHPSWMLPEEKARCLTDSWRCPGEYSS